VAYKQEASSYQIIILMSCCIAAATQQITLARAGYSLHFTIGWDIPPKLPLLLGDSGGREAKWLACWTQAQKGRVQIAVVTLSSNSLRQTAHTHHASVHQTAKLVAALLRVAGVTAGLVKSNGSLPLGL